MCTPGDLLRVARLLCFAIPAPTQLGAATRADAIHGHGAACSGTAAACPGTAAAVRGTVHLARFTRSSGEPSLRARCGLRRSF